MRVRASLVSLAILLALYVALQTGKAGKSWRGGRGGRGGSSAAAGGASSCSGVTPRCVGGGTWIDCDRETGEGGEKRRSGMFSLATVAMKGEGQPRRRSDGRVNLPAALLSISFASSPACFFAFFAGGASETAPSC